MRLFILLASITLILGVQNIFGDTGHHSPNSKDLDTYAKEELETVVKFRARVEDGLTQQYMRENKYLIRFLRASKLDLDVAENKIRENFRWRKSSNVDEIIHRNYTNSKLVRRFPFYFTVTREGRATIATGVRDIDIRQLVLSGDIEKMREYVIYGIERAVWNIHLGSRKIGREIIEGILLFNMAGFNLRSHACLQCIPLYIEVAESYEAYYPQLANKILVINTPRVFQSVFNILKPFTTGHTLNALYLYSVDKSEWGPALSKLFSPERITVEFGGTAPPQFPYAITPEQYEVMLGPAYRSAQKLQNFKNSSHV